MGSLWGRVDFFYIIELLRSLQAKTTPLQSSHLKLRNDHGSLEGRWFGHAIFC